MVRRRIGPARCRHRAVPGVVVHLVSGVELPVGIGVGRPSEQTVHLGQSPVCLLVLRIDLQHRKEDTLRLPQKLPSAAFVTASLELGALQQGPGQLVQQPVVLAEIETAHTGLVEIRFREGAKSPDCLVEKAILPVQDRRQVGHGPGIGGWFH